MKIAAVLFRLPPPLLGGFLLLLSTLAPAQSLHTRHFTNEEGLLENTPMAMLQDHDGNLWVGTRGGACWFDGHEFHPLAAGRFATDQNVTALAEASDGTMWFGHSYGGLSWLRDDRMHTYLPRGYDKPNLVLALHLTNAKTLWIGSDRGLYGCRMGLKDTTVVHPLLVPGRPDVQVNALCQGPPGQLLVATDGGLVAVDATSGQVVAAGLPPLVGGAVVCTFVRRVSDTLFWVASTQVGLVRLTRAGPGQPWRTRRYTMAQGLCSNQVLNALQDRMGRVWTISLGGMSRLDPDGTVTCFADEEPMYDYPSGLLEDREGNLWSGRGMDGLRQRLGDERLGTVAAKGMPKGKITTVLEVGPGTYWLGSLHGTVIYRPGAAPGRQIEALPPGHLVRNPLTRTDDFVYCLYRDGRGRLWQGSASGLACFDFGTRRWTWFSDVPGLARQTVMSIVADRNGRLWFATLTNGVTMHDPATGRFHSFAENEAGGPGTLDCWNLFRDAHGEVWLGTDSNGLLHLDADRQTFSRVPGSEKLTGLCDIADDRRGGLWLVSYNTGLIHFDGQRFQPRNYQLGLLPATVMSVVADTSGRVWAGTSQGLDSFDPRGGPVTRYGVSEGFGGHGTVARAITLDRTGQLWVGTQEGLMRYSPQLVRHNPVPPTTHLTGVRLFLKDTVAQAGLTLPHRLNHLSFDYIGVSLTNPERVRYRYRLRGFDEQWVGPLAATSATYTNLPPGDYTFEVKAANNDGVWDTHPATFAFVISPPWWRTWWAYVLYAGAVGMTLFGWRNYTLGQAQLHSDLRLERLALGHLQELDKVKTNFFTNISHEFRTPLTLILGPAEELAHDSPDPATRRKSSLIFRNAQRLLRLINQLLDLSKLEAGAMQLHPAPGDVAALMRQLAATFASMAEAQGIRFVTSGPMRLPFVFDTAKLEIILTNLLSNALRYTPAGGEVELRWSELPATANAPAQVELLVRDTGPGIAPEQLPWLFDRFYQGEHPTTPGAQPGTGVGLTLVKELTELHGGIVTVSSPSGQGATFTVRLPHGLRPAPAEVETEDAGDDAKAVAAVPTDAAAATVTEIIATEKRGNAVIESEVEEATPAPEADLVLFIEDNEDVREFIRLSLEPAGYRLLEAADGLRGVEMALENVPDLIISDVMMPGLDGYGVVRQLKEHPATSHVPIVLLTAKSAPTDRLEGLETGADAYLGKPFASRELRAQIRNLLALRDRTRAFGRTLQAAATNGAAVETDVAEAAPAPPLLSAIDRKFMAKVEAAVAEHLADSEFDVDQLSSAVALSRTQTQRKLKALTGLAPAEYIRNTRLARALVLLQERAGTVSEVGYEVGFSSPAHFSTVFSKHFGYPPSEVAKR